MLKSTGKHNRFGDSPFGKRLEGYSFTDFGPAKTRYTYTREYYFRKLTDKEALKRRIFNYVASVCAIICFFIAGFPRSVVNSSKYLGLLNGISIICFIWLIYILIVMMIHKNKLTIWAYRVTALQFFWCLALCSFLGVLSVIYTIVYITTVNQDTLSTDILGCILRAVGSVLFILMLITELRTRYDTDYSSCL